MNKNILMVLGVIGLVSFAGITIVYMIIAIPGIYLLDQSVNQKMTFYNEVTKQPFQISLDKEILSDWNNLLYPFSEAYIIIGPLSMLAVSIYIIIFTRFQMPTFKKKHEQK